MSSKAIRRKAQSGRIPAPALERAVADRMQSFFQSTAEVLDALRRTDRPDVDYQKVLNHANGVSSDWPRMAQFERADLIRAMLYRVMVHESSIELQINLDSLVQVLSGKLPAGESKSRNPQIFSSTDSFRYSPLGKILKLVIGNDRTESVASREAIAKAIARARFWRDEIVQGIRPARSGPPARSHASLRQKHLPARLPGARNCRVPAEQPRPTADA
jgi:hypothetical protein